jgi:hypothetical protein
LIVASGIAVGGWLVGDGVARGRAADRYVTVKGIAEREVKAEVATAAPPRGRGQSPRRSSRAYLLRP